MPDRTPSQLQIQRESLIAQAQDLSQMLSRVSSSDILGKMSLENRLEAVERDLEEIARLPSTVANVALLFSGAPVVGSRSIDATFAGKAISCFQDVIEKRLAFLKSGPLGSRGPVSKRVYSRLKITGLAFGSFGFVFEEEGADEPEMFDSAVRETIKQTIEDVGKIISSDSEKFEEFIDEVDARVFTSIKNWFNILDESDAQIELIDQDHDVILDRYKVSMASKNLSEINVDEELFEAEGVLWGLLPLHRRFEFRVDETGDVISGTVGPKLSSDYLERIERGGWAGVPMIGEFAKKTITYVEGRENVTYRLVDLLERKPDIRDK